MGTTNFISILILSAFLFSCKGETEKKSLVEKKEIFEPRIDFNEIESDYMKWWTYHSYNISLASNFIGLNEQSDTIGKKEFLEKLLTTDFIPLGIKSNTDHKTYKLFKLSSKADNSIGNTIKNESKTSLKHFKMEGTALPDFNFTDLKGNDYTNESTKGKVLILKTWYINCKACVAEFPELNELVEKYDQRTDMVFLSLALDTETELGTFLQKKDFKYQVVPNQENFIAEKLDLQIYPTHLVVDKYGNILKVVNKASEMISFFENVKYLTEKATLPPPPPPM